MKKEDLEDGNKLQSRIRQIEENIETIKGCYYDKLSEEAKKTVDYVNVKVKGDRVSLRIKENEVYTEKANTNLTYLNQLYRDNVLRTLEDCKSELKKEFESL